MKKRLLITLLLLGMILQSFSLPVLASSEEQSAMLLQAASTETETDLEGPTPKEDTVSTGKPDATPETEDMTEPEQSPEAEETKTPTQSPEADETEEPEQSPGAEATAAPTQTPGEEPAVPTQSPEAEESATPTQIPVGSASPSAIPSSTPMTSATPSATRLPSPSATPSGTPEIQMDYTTGGEGVYQEGSFTVLGESESQKAKSWIDKARLADSDRSEAEEYLYQQLLARSERIDIEKYNVSKSEREAYVYGVINDHPELYFVRTSFSSWLSGEKVIAIEPEYLNGLDDNAFQNMLNNALGTINSGMSEMEKAITLHDYIVLNCEYDYSNLQAGTLPKEVYTAYGVLVDRKAVCQGYALAYKLLLNKAGIECYMVSSDAMNHAWNLIKLDGQYYQVDTTWDDPIINRADRFGEVRHNYMFVSDKAFSTTTNERNRHYDWVITKGSQTIGLTADSTTYDNEFWINITSPLIMGDNMCYYIESSGDYDNKYGNIVQRNILNGIESRILSGIGVWTSLDGGYWEGVFSGLFRIGNRLYYNTPTHICSISLDGGEQQINTEPLGTTDGQYVYSSAFCQGEVKYQLKSSPNDSVGTILTAALQDINVEVEKVVLDRQEAKLPVGRTVKINATVVPSYAKEKEVTWESSDPGVATVDAGVITAVGAGNCIITASAGEKSAQCQVTVIGKPESPVFPERRTVDKGGTVTITSESNTKIYYTVNGDNPNIFDTETTVLYTEPIVVNENITIKAIAAAEYDVNAYIISDVAEASFTACTNNLTLDEEAVTLMEGEEKALKIAELPTTKSESDVEWESDKTDVVTVDASGRLTAGREGEATVTARVTDHKGESVTASCQVTVKAPIYQVTFTGFQGKVLKTESVKARENATPPKYDKVNPEESEFEVPVGYDFAGWDGSFENIRQDTEIKAKYELINYKITYELNGGNAPENPDAYTIESETIVLQPADGKEGFVFTGWYEDRECQGNPVSVIEKGSHRDITLYAGWKDERGLWLQAEGTDKANEIPAQVYTGKAIKPAVTVMYGDKPLTVGKDYTVSYKNNTKVNLLETEAELKKAPTVTIKGKGNFAGTLIKTFTIEPKSIEDGDVQVDNLASAYNKGKLIKPVPTVKWNGKKLANKRDFTVEYPDLTEDNPDAYKAYKEPGEYRILVQGCGNYTGKREITFTITNPSENEILISKVKVSKIPDFIYNGEAVVLTQDMPKLTMGNYTLKLKAETEEPDGSVETEDYDYTLEYGECKDIGTYEVLIVGHGAYKGERRVSFKIKGAAASTMKVSKMPKLVYTGGELVLDSNALEGAENKLTITDKAGITTLKENVDYTLSFSNNVNVGTAKMKITGMGAYSGTVNKTYKIVPRSLAEGSEGVTAELAVGGEQIWQSGGVKPKVRVTFNGMELIEGTDYTLSYKNNTSLNVKPGKEPTVIIKGKKNYTGSRQLTFEMVRKDIADVNITAPDMEKNTKAGKYMSVPILTDTNGKKLKAGTDYEKTYVYTDENGTELTKKDCPLAGSTLTVKVTGKGNYYGKTSVSFRIIEKGNILSKAKVTVKDKIYYTGENITLSKDSLIVSIGKTTLQTDDYEIVANSYINNVKKGTAKVTIRGKGEYGGTKQISFKILSQNMKWWEKVRNTIF